MKALGIVGSPRKGGNTEYATNLALQTLAKEGIETELVTLAGKTIMPCIACGACASSETCSHKDDFMPIYWKMREADAIILATPVYMSSATALIKGLMERAGLISRSNGRPFKGKAGGPIVVGRRGGHNFTFAQMNYWYQILEFYMTGASYWTMALGKAIGEVENDAEGKETIVSFAENLAYLMKKLYA